jgi:hypothetical protein
MTSVRRQPPPAVCAAPSAACGPDTLALLFLFTVENRIKRSRALKSLYVLRSLAHIIDMHQLAENHDPRPG